MKQKYVVLKVEDVPTDVLHAWKAEGKALDEGSFFVIRDTDVFGPAALFGYAHILQTVVELNRLRPSFTPEEADYLSETGDALVSLALRWQQSSGKVPD